MNLEAAITNVHEHFFFREFTFAKNQFSPSPNKTYELADNIIWIGDVLIALQLKERDCSQSTDSEREARWFEDKVIKKATKQVRDTLSYLEEYSSIQIENRRGDKLELLPSSLARVYKVVCHRPHPLLPADCRHLRYYLSSTAGVVHLFDSEDYFSLTRVLLTPPEMAEYLEFREELVVRWGDRLTGMPEQALVGQYLSGNAEAPPTLGFASYLEALEHRVDEWDMSGIISKFLDKSLPAVPRSDQYKLLTEIAKLKRKELHEFKLRLQLSLRKSAAGQMVSPYRFASVRTGCGFLFIPLSPKQAPHRRRALLNLTLACKYDMRLDKCVGATVLAEGNGEFSVEWCYADSAWRHDGEMEALLAENNPFRSVSIGTFDRYEFRNDEIDPA